MMKQLNGNVYLDENTGEVGLIGPVGERGPKGIPGVGPGPQGPCGDGYDYLRSRLESLPPLIFLKEFGCYIAQFEKMVRKQVVGVIGDE